jgi:tetratricopeptide (TPR) repeat protein
VRPSLGAAIIVAAAVVTAGACAKRVAVPIPEAQDYVFPAPAAGELAAAEAKALRTAWTEVLAGDAAKAQRRLERLRRPKASRPSVDTALGYARLRQGRTGEAAEAFAAALARAPFYLPGLVGAGSAAATRGDEEAALAFYRRAQAGAPGDALVRKRVGSLKLGITEKRMARAQAALETGDTAAAEADYRAVLDVAPEVAPVRLALADLLAGRGEMEAAAAVLASDPTGDHGAALRRAGLLLALGDFDGAEAAYRGLLSRDPADAAARAGLAAARDAREAAAMPEEYRRIPAAARVSRADLAALLATRVKALQRTGPGEPRVAVDIAGSWAREPIAMVLALEVMDLYPNHTFQPWAAVRRVDLARAAARILDRLRWPRATAAPPADMPPSHLDYEAVERALGAGVMSLAADGAFEPSRPVTGPEAIEVVDAVARLVSP